MKFSKNFWVAEFEQSSTATRLGIDNSIPSAKLLALDALCTSVLQPTRDHFILETKKGKSVTITSGYRCTELNNALGSRPSSQHIKGEAADFVIYGVDNYEIACWIRDNLEFDQLILEMYEPALGKQGWVHVSYCEFSRNRGQCITVKPSGVTKRGLVV